ncbi:MAG TPA: hypothetical protein PLO37_06965 [Candidatus Hydrogenedentes bacterium]|nr:hypothetical protein [Candidatus Hydrogenedentota bacterium]HPG66572.1 hypothetical protein [Candidatus Hydrogenedentota bacterium]
MSTPHLKSDEGMALLLTLFFLSIALMTLSVLSARMINESRQIDHFVAFNNCFQGVEAAVAASEAGLKGGGTGLVGVTSWQPPSGATTLDLPTFDSENVHPVQLPSMPDVEYFAVALDWSNDGLDNNGDGLVDGTEEIGYFSLYGFARNGDVVRSAEVIMEASDINVWNNAVFAGAGHVSGAVKGNCSIHGSVHILGDHIPEGGEALVVLDMMGASLIHNNYEPGPGLSLSARETASLPPLPHTLFGGEEVETLNASLRVKRGLVSLNSASEIGSANELGNDVKETMDGTYNEDGWTGSRVVDDGGRGDPTVVHSDNGWDQGYDLGNAVAFPTLDDEWRWPARVDCYELGYDSYHQPGSTEPSPDGDDYGHGEFFADALSDGAPYNGDVYIKQGGANVYINLSRPGDPDPAHRVKNDPANCVKGDDYIFYNAATGVVEINGQVEVNGNLQIEGKAGGGTASLYYTGRAAILVHGNVILDSDLVPCNNGNPNDYVRSFPERNFLGLMAEQDMLVGVQSQIRMMGGFYAQGTVTSNKQSLVCGSFVAEYFDMGQQVPDIYQVPEVADNLPLGMIGNWPIWAFSPLSWREIGV